jgi:NhaA family Na+:H+ antiporter
VGKPVAVTAAAWLAIRLRLATRPEGTSWGAMLGVGILAGIGFTMSLFIAGLAFGDTPLLDAGKRGVLFASIVAAIAGAAVLYGTPGRRTG